MNITKFEYNKEFMNNNGVHHQSKYVRPKWFDHSRKYGEIGIPIVWTTNYNPMEIESHGYFDKDWVKDRTLYIDLEDFDMTTYDTPLDIGILNTRTTLPKNWNSMVEEYEREVKEENAINKIKKW
jgi:hypothetical protein